jgi:potassium efflux system protein
MPSISVREWRTKGKRCTRDSTLKRLVNRRPLSSSEPERPTTAKLSPAVSAAARRITAGRQTGRFWIAALTLLLFLRPAVCQDMPAAATLLEAVTTGTLEAKLAKIEAATGIEEETRTKLIELYRQSLDNLQDTSSNAEAAEDFESTAKTAPGRIEAIREQIAESAAASAEYKLDIEPGTPLPQLEQRLLEEKASLADAQARRLELEKRLKAEASGPSMIRQRLGQAKQEQEETAAQLKLPPTAGEGPATAEARRWVLETRSAALAAEMEMLEQELLSQPLRIDLLQAERDRAVASVRLLDRQVELLEALINRNRQQEAQQAKDQAEMIRREAEGAQPLVRRLAEQNAALSEELAETLSELDALAEQIERTDERADRIEAQLGRAEDAMNIGGLTQELGRLLQRQRKALPKLRAQRLEAKQRKARAADVGARRLIHLEEFAQLQDMDTYLADLLEETKVADTPDVRQQLRELASHRTQLLEQAVETAELAVRRLDELKSAQRRLQSAITVMDAFLDEHLLWVRSRSAIQLVEARAKSDQPWVALDLAGLRDLGHTLVYQATHSPVFALLAIGLAVLFLTRGRMLATIRSMSDKLGKPTTDNFGYTLSALVLTMILAGAWPLLVAVTGWQLKASAESSDLTNNVGVSLLVIASHFYLLRILRAACMPEGLAAAHFRWPESSVRLSRSEADRLTWVFLPAALAALITSSLDPLDVGSAVWRLFFQIAVGYLAFALYRLLHPQRGVFAAYLRDRQRRTLKQLYRVGYPLVVAFPVGLGVLSLSGYRYLAGALTELFLETLWLLVSVIFAAALAKRWLLVSRRRLAYDAAMDRREAQLATQARAERKPGSVEEGSVLAAEEPEVDVLDLSDRSRKLVNTGLLLYGLFGLWVIWSDVLPAFSILDQVTLWHQRVLVDGQQQVLPVTLAGVGMALIYLAITVILAKQLPAVLEIILLQYTEMSAGSRYTVTTLTNYVIVTTGLVLVFKTLGADWSQLQWLVAALGVGIGFGLQEIIANFVSGIIILFERPIRIGDVVTVGETDGVVTRIRGRATTIRNWDGKELLVPNKEFITGRLLNWSLSDQATRIVISVGIAYGSNVREAMNLLEQAARENPNVLDDPPPSVIFETFGDNALGLLLRCFVDSVDVRYPVMSALNESINTKLNAAGIAIAFPQRDLHLDTPRPLKVELSRERPLPSGAAPQES